MKKISLQNFLRLILLGLVIVLAVQIYRAIFIEKASVEAACGVGTEFVLQDIQNEVIRNGDIDAYEELAFFYIMSCDDSNAELSLLPYSFIMAHKYNYPDTYYHIFEILTSIDGCSFDYDLRCLDEETRALALEYLIQAVERGEYNASFVFTEFIYNKQGLNLPKDIFGMAQDVIDNYEMVDGNKIEVYFFPIGSRQDLRYSLVINQNILTVNLFDSREYLEIQLSTDQIDYLNVLISKIDTPYEEKLLDLNGSWSCILRINDKDLYLNEDCSLDNFPKDVHRVIHYLIEVSDIEIDLYGFS